jgi:hypothetical protein
MKFRPEIAPALYEQDGKGYDAIVYAHYFLGSSDWLVTEYDPDTDEAFGWACINGDRQLAELGYVSLTELEAITVRIPVEINGRQMLGGVPQHVERDAHWPEGLTITEAIARLDARDGKAS